MYFKIYNFHSYKRTIFCKNYCSNSTSSIIQIEANIQPQDIIHPIAQVKIENFVTYKEIYDMENLEKGLARTKSGVLAGLDGEVKANYTTKKLLQLSEALKQHKYKPNPMKKVMIAKSDGGKRPLAISSQQDKIIQATLLILLEPIFEKIFLDSSMGFRPKRGCHNALHLIKKRWQNVT